MVDTEIWLRLMSISSLYGDDMVRIAHWLAKQSHNAFYLDIVINSSTGYGANSCVHSSQRSPVRWNPTGMCASMTRCRPCPSLDR